MTEEKQTAASLMKELGAQLEEFRESPEQIAAWLRWNNNFHDYSPTNRMYIWLQLPGATKVASFKKWQSLDRQVVKGSKSIVIFAPNTFAKKKKDEEDENEKPDMVFSFRKVPVFDISQTEGEPIDLTPGVKNTPTLEQLAEEMREKFAELGVTIEKFTSDPETLSGYRNRLVSLNSIHSDSVQSVSLVRAMALYHLNENLKDSFSEPMTAYENSWIANAATWALLERRGIDAGEYTATLLTRSVSEHKFKELLTATDKVVTFLDALDAGIPAEWATAIIADNGSAVA